LSPARRGLLYALIALSAAAAAGLAAGVYAVEASCSRTLVEPVIGGYFESLYSYTPTGNVYVHASGIPEGARVTVTIAGSGGGGSWVLTPSNPSLEASVGPGPFFLTLRVDAPEGVGGQVEVALGCPLR